MFDSKQQECQQEEIMLTRRLRHRTQKINYLKKILCIGICSLGLYLAIWQFTRCSEDSLPVSAAVGLRQQALQLPKWHEALFLGIPRFIAATDAKLLLTQKRESNPPEMLRDMILFFANIDLLDMRSLLQAEIPVLASIKTDSQVVSAMNIPDFPKFEMANSVANEKPLVGLYFTHTAESFVPTAGVTHRPGGQRGDIVDVGEALGKKLNTYGIKTVQNNTIHDYPSFMKAYGVSEITASKMLAENPSLQMLFDVHRDADKRENYLVNINGIPVAKIMIIVTTGQQGLVQPHWQQNHAFAKLIDAKLNQRYPGLSRGIRMDDWRYNQHLHPRALLIEVGCQENTKEEAERGIELFGDIVAEIIQENK